MWNNWRRLMMCFVTPYNLILIFIHELVFIFWILILFKLILHRMNTFMVGNVFFWFGEAISCTVGGELKYFEFFFISRMEFFFRGMCWNYIVNVSQWCLAVKCGLKFNVCVWKIMKIEIKLLDLPSFSQME